MRAADFANVHPNLDAWRNNWATPSEEIVLYVGRHVFEKGIDLLLSAVPKVLSYRPRAKFIIAGTGPMTDELKRQACDMGLGEKVLFPGFVDDLTRNSLYRLADAAVFPSRYEPFGIVALEAMAAMAPVVVSDVGGFRETVEHGQNGLTFYAGNSNSLADNILNVLGDKAFAQTLKARATQDLKEKFDWKQIAKQTVESFQEVAPKPHDNKESYDRYQITSTFGEKGDVHVKAIIMAGGEERDSGPCTIPKPMVPILNRPMMEHILNLLKRHGFKEVASTLWYLPDDVTAYFQDGSDFGVSMSYYIEREPLGTAGSVKNAARFLDDTFVVVSGDALTDIDLTKAIVFHKQRVLWPH